MMGSVDAACGRWGPVFCPWFDAVEIKSLKSALHQTRDRKIETAIARVLADSPPKLIYRELLEGRPRRRV